MELEDKAKVVASVWGAEFVQFPAALAVLPRSIWKKRLNSAGLFGKKLLNQPCLSKLLRQNSKRGKELNKFCPPNRRDDLCLAFCFNPSSMPKGFVSVVHSGLPECVEL